MRLLPWQQADWTRFAAQFDRLPGALLLTGQEGIGKDRFAAFVAQSLLCEQLGAEHAACGQCEACRWFLAGNHPDYRRLAPDTEADEGEDDGKAKAKPARKQAVIKIDAVREVIDFAQLSAHRGGRRVVVIDPAEALNLAAANALLKILEEPPQDVHFVLVAHRPRRLLATLLSRCRLFALTPPEPVVALDWLAQQGRDDAAVELAHAGNAPLALTDPALLPLRERFTAGLAHPDAATILAVAADLDRAKLALAEPLEWLRKWCHDLSAARLGGKIRYYPDKAAALERLAQRVPAPRLARFDAELVALAPYGQHTLNVRLQLEKLLFDYQRLFAA